MSNVIQFPLLNPIIFRRAATGQYWLESKKNFEQTKEYFHPWQWGDRIRFQISYKIDHYYIFGGYIALRKCGTGELITFPIPENITVDQNQTNVVVCTYSLIVPNITGNYFFELYLPVIAGGHEHFYTEGLNFKQTQENTSMFEFSCDGIQHDVWFINNLLHEVKFYYRFPGGFKTKDFSVKSNSNVYADQTNAFTLLSGFTYNTKKLTIGSGQGCPNYVADTINRILVSDLTCNIDDVAHSKTSDSAMEQVEYADNYTRGIWKIELAETPNDELTGFDALPEDINVDPIDISQQIITLDDVDKGLVTISGIENILYCIVALPDNSTYICGVIKISDDEYTCNVGDIPNGSTTINIIV